MTYYVPSTFLLLWKPTSSLAIGHGWFVPQRVILNLGHRTTKNASLANPGGLGLGSESDLSCNRWFERRHNRKRPKVGDSGRPDRVDLRSVNLHCDGPAKQRNGNYDPMAFLEADKNSFEPTQRAIPNPNILAHLQIGARFSSHARRGYSLDGSHFP